MGFVVSTTTGHPVSSDNSDSDSSLTRLTLTFSLTLYLRLITSGTYSPTPHFRRISWYCCCVGNDILIFFNVLLTRAL